MYLIRQKFKIFILYLTGQKQGMTELKFSSAGHLDRPTSSRYFQPCNSFVTKIYFAHMVTKKHTIQQAPVSSLRTHNYQFIRP